MMESNTRILLILCLGISIGLPQSSYASSSSGVVFCYYGSWANTRNGSGRFGVSDIPLNLCTHILYSFILPTPTGELRFDTEETVEGKSNSVKDFTALKESNSDLKLLVAIGGWNEGSTNFSTIVNNDTLRAAFVNNLVTYIDEKGFDGLDLDWEYSAQRDGVDSDKEQFIVLIKDLKEVFEPKGYLLTAAVAVTQSHIDLSYNVTAMNEYLDYINLMTYDYHGTWDTSTGVVAPLYAQLTDDETVNLNVNSSVHIWIENGASPSKLVLGMPVYGRTFTLVDASNASTGAAFTGAGEGGPYLNESASYSYLEICEDQQTNPDDWSITEVTDNYVYANKGTFWVGYDNENTIYAKGKFANDMGLAGIMYWAVDLDDFIGSCGTEFAIIKKGIEGYNAA